MHLNATKDATEIDVRKAYRKLVGALVNEVIRATTVQPFSSLSAALVPFDEALRHHPDKHPGTHNLQTKKDAETDGKAFVVCTPEHLLEKCTKGMGDCQKSRSPTLFQ